LTYIRPIDGQVSLAIRNKMREIDIFKIMREDSYMLYRKEFWGVILLILGGLLLLGNLDFIDHRTRHIFRSLWPIVVILVGLALIIYYGRSRKVQQDFYSGMPAGQADHHGQSHVFGDHRIDAKDMDVDGLNISTVFGDTELDLSSARLKTGVNYIELSSSFGEVVVTIPSTMEIMVYGSVDFGDLHVLDKSASGIGNKLTVKTPGYDAASAKLNILAKATFGSVKITRA